MCEVRVNVNEVRQFSTFNSVFFARSFLFRFVRLFFVIDPTVVNCVRSEEIRMREWKTQRKAQMVNREMDMASINK